VQRLYIMGYPFHIGIMLPFPCFDREKGLGVRVMKAHVCPYPPGNGDYNEKDFSIPPAKKHRVSVEMTDLCGLLLLHHSIFDIRFFTMGNSGMDYFVRNYGRSARFCLYIGRPAGAYSFYLSFLLLTVCRYAAIIESFNIDDCKIEKPR